MEIKVLKTDDDYKTAVQYLEKLGDSPDFEDREDLITEFDALADLIEKYEEKHFPIETTDDPIELIKIAMYYRDLKQKDLYHIASKGIISEILNKKRAMSKKIIRELSKFLLIDQEALNVDYELKKVTKKAKDKINFPIKSYFIIPPELLKNTNNYQNIVRQNKMMLNIRANH